jgi:hypothetical protein
MLLNTLLLIISSLLVTTNAQCPIAWWPLGYFSNSVGFFTEVMRGNNAGYLNMNPLTTDTVAPASIYGVMDRVGTNSGRSITFIPAGTMNLQVNPDFYFCGAFTVTLWINPIAGAAGAVVFDFRDATLANGYQLTLAASGLQLILNSFSTGVATAVANTGAAAALTLGAISVTAPVWNFVAITFSGVSGSQPSFYNARLTAPTAAQTLATGNAITTPTCNQISRAFIGNVASSSAVTATTGFGGSLSDLKIYNFQMTLTQVAARYTAELS